MSGPHDPTCTCSVRCHDLGQAECQAAARAVAPPVPNLGNQWAAKGNTSDEMYERIQSQGAAALPVEPHDWRTHSSSPHHHKDGDPETVYWDRVDGPPPVREAGLRDCGFDCMCMCHSALRAEPVPLDVIARIASEFYGKTDGPELAEYIAARLTDPKGATDGE